MPQNQTTSIQEYWAENPTVEKGDFSKTIQVDVFCLHLANPSLNGLLGPWWIYEWMELGSWKLIDGDYYLSLCF